MQKSNVFYDIIVDENKKKRALNSLELETENRRLTEKVKELTDALANVKDKQRALVADTKVTEPSSPCSGPGKSVLCWMALLLCLVAVFSRDGVSSAPFTPPFVVYNTLASLTLFTASLYAYSSSVQSNPISILFVYLCSRLHGVLHTHILHISNAYTQHTHHTHQHRTRIVPCQST